MSGAACQRPAPDSTGREAEHGGNNEDREEKLLAGERERGTANATDSMDATGEGGDIERRGKSRQSNEDTFRGRRNGEG